MPEPISAYLAPVEYAAELEAELQSREHLKIIERFGRLFLVEGQPEPSLAWAQDTWPDPRKIAIESIGDAVRKLKSMGRHWALESYQLHRRAALIQSQLPKLKTAPLKFLGPLPELELGSWTLLAPDLMLASPRSLSRWPLGEIQFQENKSAPSRAYLKLWELFTARGLRPPSPGERCLELGASPGGWTWVLANLGCDVIAVDRAPLAAKIARLPNVAFVKGNAFSVDPRGHGHINWLFSDLICYPAQLFDLVGKWRKSGHCRNFVCTVKLKGASDAVSVARFAAIANSHLQHLSCNRHELTWWLCDDA